MNLSTRLEAHQRLVNKGWDRPTPNEIEHEALVIEDEQRVAQSHAFAAKLDLILKQLAEIKHG